MHLAVKAKKTGGWNIEFEGKGGSPVIVGPGRFTTPGMNVNDGFKIFVEAHDVSEGPHYGFQSGKWKPVRARDGDGADNGLARANGLAVGEEVEIEFATVDDRGLNGFTIRNRDGGGVGRNVRDHIFLNAGCRWNDIGPQAIRPWIRRYK